MEIATGPALCSPSPVSPVTIRQVLIGDPQGHDEPMALLGTDQQAEAVLLVSWLVWRWTVEVTFPEGSAHLGVETPRHWSEVAILRTTPALPDLFSLVALLAQQRWDGQAFPVRRAAWASKALPTFSDALADLRQHVLKHLEKVYLSRPFCAEELSSPSPVISSSTGSLRNSWAGQPCALSCSISAICQMGTLILTRCLTASAKRHPWPGGSSPRSHIRRVPASRRWKAPPSTS